MGIVNKIVIDSYDPFSFKINGGEGPHPELPAQAPFFLVSSL